jgi:hypothetical protein
MCRRLLRPGRVLRRWLLRGGYYGGGYGYYDPWSSYGGFGGFYGGYYDPWYGGYPADPQGGGYTVL